MTRSTFGQTTWCCKDCGEDLSWEQLEGKIQDLKLSGCRESIGLPGWQLDNTKRPVKVSLSSSSAVHLAACLVKKLHYSVTFSNAHMRPDHWGRAIPGQTLSTWTCLILCVVAAVSVWCQCWLLYPDAILHGFFLFCFPSMIWAHKTLFDYNLDHQSVSTSSFYARMLFHMF